MSTQPHPSQAELLPPEKTGKKLAKCEKPGPVEVTTPMQLVAMAVQQGADVEKLSKLMDLQERWEKNEARKAFVVAMNAFKASPPEIIKNRHVAFGNTSYDHATLDHVCEQIGNALSRHGISHRWSVEQKSGLIRVSCVLTHEKGHSEETTLEGPADSSGSKNAIQSIGSAVTYLERYSLLAATGLAAKGQDTDGMLPEPLPGLDTMLKAIASAPDMSALTTIYKEAYKQAHLAKNATAENALITAKDKRKAELTATEAA